MIASLLVRRSRTRKELSVTKFGKLWRDSIFILYSHFAWVSMKYRIRKGQSVTIPISLINRDISIWGEDAAEFKFVMFLILFLVGNLIFFFLDLSVGQTFQMLPHVYLESGRTFCHSLVDLELVSVFDFHLWSESSIFPLVISCSNNLFLPTMNQNQSTALHAHSGI